MLLGAAQYYLSLFDGDQNVGRAIEHFFCLRCSFDAKVSNSMLCLRLFYGAHDGVHETLEMMYEMLHSFDHPEQSSTEQERAKASKGEQRRAKASKGEQRCTLLGEMLDSFDKHFAIL